MDQDDRKDGSRDTTNITETTENTDFFSVSQRKDMDSEVEKANGMIHAKVEVNARGISPDLEPAEIKTIETTTVESEIEPSTVAFVSENLQPTETKIPNDTPTETDVASNTVTTPAVASQDHRNNKKMTLIIVAFVLFLGIIGVLAWAILEKPHSQSSSNNKESLSTTKNQAMLGVAFTFIDGSVEFSNDNDTWQSAQSSSELKQGDYVRSRAESRAVLSLDDGSAVRLDANTAIHLESLSVDNVVINHIYGTVYSRVAPSERSYLVNVNETTYKALGTAFVTYKNTSMSGIQVFQSSVESSELDTVIIEGRQHLKPFGDYKGEVAITDIDIDVVSDNAFLNWNLSQDESDKNFKERLGILSKVKERAAAKIAERKALEEKQREEAEAAERAKVESDRIAKEKESLHSGKVTRGTMTLSLTGKTFRWNYTGKATYGYKLVYSKKSAMPTFGIHDSLYFSNSNEISGEFARKGEIDSGKYHVRVCAYTANTEDTGCVDYSNVVVINMN